MFLIKNGKTRIEENIIRYAAIERGGASLFLIRTEAVETAIIAIIIARLGEIFGSLLNIRKEAPITIYVKWYGVSIGYFAKYTNDVSNTWSN